MRSTLAGRAVRALALVAALVVAAPLAAQQAAGTVRDAQTGAALGGVRVSSGARHTFTAADGRYSLALPADTATLAFSRLGYTPLSLRAHALAAEVRLVPAPLLLGAITVEAQGRTKLATGTALALAEVERERVHAHGSTSTAEALAGAPGVSISRPGAWGAKAVVRGLGGERVAVMIDGNRVNRACVFGMDDGLASIDPSTIERVEILSGPGSTLYGSGNIGGVINVVTRRGVADTDGVSGEVRAGASSTVPGGSLGGSIALRRGATDLSVALDGARYGDYRAPGGRVEGSSFRQGTFDARLARDLDPAQRVSLQAQLYEGREIGWPAMPGHEMSIPEESRRSLAADYGWQIGRGALDALSARAFVQRLDHHMVMSMHHDHDGMLMSTETDAQSRSATAGGRVQLRLQPVAASSHLDLGVETTHLAAEATRWTEQAMDGHDPDRTTLRSWPAVRILDVGIFSQGELRLNDALTATAGARADRVTRHAEGWSATGEWVGTGNLGLRLALPHGFDARTTLGYGYRTPDATELFGLAIRPDGFVYRGNPELRTETSRNLEASLGYAGGALSAEVTAYRNDLAHLITPVLAAGDSVAGRPVREYTNLRRARLAGFHGSAALRLPAALSLRGDAGYTRGEDRASGAALAQIPPFEGGLALRSEPARGVEWIEIEGRGAARQGRIAASAGEVATPGYGVLNLRAGFEIGRSQVVAGIDNLLDHAYRGHLDPVALQRPGRNLYVKLTREF
jgi:outer membrane receptor protein involved in Fe transport